MDRFSKSDEKRIGWFRGWLKGKTFTRKRYRHITVKAQKDRITIPVASWLDDKEDILAVKVANNCIVVGMSKLLNYSSQTYEIWLRAILEAAKREGIKVLRSEYIEADGDMGYTCRRAFGILSEKMATMARASGTSYKGWEIHRLIEWLSHPYPEERTEDIPAWYRLSSSEHIAITKDLINAFDPLETARFIRQRIIEAGFGEQLKKDIEEVRGLGSLRAIENLGKEDRKNKVANGADIDNGMVTKALLHLMINGGPTAKDDADSKHLGRVLSVVYQMCGGNGQIKAFASLGARIFQLKNSPPEEAIRLLNDKSSLIAGAAAAALS